MTFNAQSFRVGTRIVWKTKSGVLTASGVLLSLTGDDAKGRFVIRALQLQNESSTATTIVFRNGTREMWRVLGQNQGDGCGYSFGDEGIGLEYGTDMNLVITGGSSVGYSILYGIERGN